MPIEVSVRPTGNRLLDALPQGDYDKIADKLKLRPIRIGDILVDTQGPMRDVYFPREGVISLVTPLIDGVNVETATVGNEGMVGVQTILGGGQPGSSMAVSQVPGDMLTMEAQTFRESVGDDGKLHGLLLAYTQALLAQVSQTAACNATHDLPQRAARWILQTHDRVTGDSIHLTQQFLADMLAVTRPSVTVAARTLQSAGLITHSRGHVRVLDRKGLEEAACECYATVKQEYARLLPGV